MWSVTDKYRIQVGQILSLQGGHLVPFVDFFSLTLKPLTPKSLRRPPNETTNRVTHAARNRQSRGETERNLTEPPRPLPPDFTHWNEEVVCCHAFPKTPPDGWCHCRWQVCWPVEVPMLSGHSEPEPLLHLYWIFSCSVSYSWNSCWNSPRNGAA